MDGSSSSETRGKDVHGRTVTPKATQSRGLIRDLLLRLAKKGGAFEALWAEAIQTHVRLAEPIEVLVVGLEKAGKSTFLNGLLGSVVAPAGVNPTTAYPTKYVYDVHPRTARFFQSGKQTTHDELLPTAIQADLRDSSSDRIAHEEKTLQSEFLRYISVWDSAGFGGLDEAAQTPLKHYPGEAKVVLYCISATSHLKPEDVKYVEEVATKNPKAALLYVLTRCDLLHCDCDPDYEPGGCPKVQSKVRKVREDLKKHLPKHDPRIFCGPVDEVGNGNELSVFTIKRWELIDEVGLIVWNERIGRLIMQLDDARKNLDHEALNCGSEIKRLESKMKFVQRLVARATSVLNRLRELSAEMGPGNAHDGALDCRALGMDCVNTPIDLDFLDTLEREAKDGIDALGDHPGEAVPNEMIRSIVNLRLKELRKLISRTRPDSPPRDLAAPSGGARGAILRRLTMKTETGAQLLEFNSRHESRRHLLLGILQAEILLSELETLVHRAGLRLAWSNESLNTSKDLSTLITRTISALERLGFGQSEARQVTRS